MTTGDSSHWNMIYTAKAGADLSWHQDEPLDSLEVIEQYAPAGSSVIDVGGGSSRLAASLVERGFGPCTVVDLSATALEQSAARTDPATASRITWRVADILETEDLGRFDVWHDRAVFHFLTEPGQQAHYLRLASQTIRPGGILVMGTFSLEGPDRCSNLPVCRYDAATLAEIFGSNFLLIAAAKREHLTPGNVLQPFVFVVLKRWK